MDFEQPSTKSPIQEADDACIRCSFSQINDLTSSINLKEINTDTSKYKYDSKKHKEPKPQNCLCYKTEKGLKIITEGGSLFNLPFEQEITNVYPLTEGLMIEFHLKHELKLQDLLTMSRSSKEKEEFDPNANEENFYSYVTLNRHPLNPLKILGGFVRKNSERPFRWYKFQEKICYISTKLPFIISYNQVLKRHAFHYIRMNVEELSKEDNSMQFQNNFYTLYNLHNNYQENPELLHHSTLLTDMFFEETNRENMLSKCEIIKGNSLSEVYIFMLINDNTSYVKLYSVDFMNQNYDNPIAVKCVKKVSVLNDVREMFTFDLFQSHLAFPKVLNLKKKMFKNIFDKVPNLKNLLRSVNRLQESIVLCHTDKSFSIYYGSQPLLKYEIEFPLSIKGMPQTSEYPFSDIRNFLDGKVDLLLENNSVLRCCVVPKIQHYLISLILKTLSYFFEEKLFDKIFSDVILNCQSGDIIEDKKYLNLDNSQNENDEYEKFIGYFVFLLKLCNKNGLGSTEEATILNDEKPSKKVKSSIDEEANFQVAKDQVTREVLNTIENNSLLKKISDESNKVDPQQTTNWATLCKSNYHISNYRSLDQLFKKKIPVRSSLLNSPSVNLLAESPRSPEKREEQEPEIQIPKFTVPLDLFYANRVKIFRILHLLYQEMKLNKLHYKRLPDMAYFLFCFAKYLNHELGTVYCDYYLRENLGVLERFKSDASLKKIDEMIQIRHTFNSPPLKQRENKGSSQLFATADQSSILEKEPPDVLKWVQNKLNFSHKIVKGQNPDVIPVAFKLTQQICKIIETLTEQPQLLQNTVKNVLKPSTNENQHPNITKSDKIIVEGEDQLVEKKHTSKTSVISDIFAKMISPALTAIQTDFEGTLKFENEYPFFNYMLLELTFSDEKETFNYKSFKKLARNKEEKIFLYLIKKKISLATVHQLAFGISTPIFEILRQMRQEIPPLLYQNLPKLAFKLIKRDDLYKNLEIYSSDKENISHKGTNTLHGLSNTINNLIRGTSKMPVESLIFATSSKDRSKHTDHAFLEANRLLETTKPMRIKPKYLEGIEEAKQETENQAILFKMCLRRFSVLIGQGAMNYATVPTLITEALKIPKVNLSAISPITNSKITLELKDEKEQALLNWPEFHNGVSNGLRLFQEIMQYDKNQLRTWIFYQRPETPKFEHGGFLLAMGLLGFLDSFMPTDIYQYLKPGHEATSVGILLGLAASRIGKMDEHTSKTLCLHIPYLLPPSYDIEIHLNIQTAALVGIGLLHMGTSNRIMTEMTLAQIGRKPLSDKCLDRDGYSLAAGYALGLINLCKGTNNPAIKDLELDERLIRFVEGGKPMDPPKSMLSSNYNFDFNKCSSVKEGNFVNTHITCPAALMALALIYLKSNKMEIVNRILIPNSFSGIEFCNPNHILLKIVTRNLIMWDKISNTIEFIYAQIPELIRFIFERPIKEVYDKYSLVYNVEEIDFNTVSLIYCNIIGGCIMSMGLKYAGTGDQKAFETIIREIEKFRRMKITKCELANDISNKNSIDNYNLSTLLCISLISLSMIMAGTSDITCLKWCRVIRKRIEDTSNMHFGFNMAIHMAIGFLFLGNGSHSFTRSNLSIAALLISIYPHFPISSGDNKYHLQALRHFYVLAAERRMFYTVDVETNKVVNLRIRLELDEGGTKKIENQQTPVLIQESKKCVSLKVLDDEYYNIEIKFKNKTLPQQKILYVRKRYPKEVDLYKYRNLGFQDEENKLDENAISDLEKSLVNDVCLLLSKSLSSSANPLTKQELLFVFPFNEKKKGNLTTKEEIAYVQNHYRQISSMHDQINQSLVKGNKSYSNEKNLIETYLQLLREDRVDLFPLYLSLMHFKDNATQIDSLFLENLNAVLKFYGNKPLITGSYESKVFNSIELEKVKNKIFSILNKDNESLRSGLIKAYLEKLEMNSALNVTDKDYDRAIDKLMKFIKFSNFPSIYDLKMIKTCIYKFKLMKSDGMTKSQDMGKTPEDKSKKVLTMCELYLYLSFPLCPKDILDQIALYYFE